MPTDSQIKQEAFTKIMGSLDMPPDDSPEYGEWLFGKSYAAGRSAGLESQQYVLIAEGEGADCRIICDLSHSTLHEFMCCCGNWETCNLEGPKDAIESLADENNWTFDEDGKPFSCRLADYETGHIDVYKLQAAAILKHKEEQ